MSYGFCPTCGTTIPKDRVQTGLEICPACGWTNSSSSVRKQQKIENSFIWAALISSALIFTTFTHIVHWDTYAIEIVPLKYKQIKKQASAEDLFRIATICEARKKPTCMEETLKQLHNNEPKNLKALQKYAQVLNFQKKHNLAIKKYAEYFSKGGTNLDAAYRFAKLLSDQGLIKHASNYYRYVLDSKPETLQVTVTEHFVDMLIEADRLDEAKMLIEGIRKKGTNTKYFLDKKLSQIEELMNKKS